MDNYKAKHYNILATANNRPAIQPNSGRTTGATPTEELEDGEEEATERVAVDSTVEGAEFLEADELKDPLPDKEAEELDPEPEEAGLALTMPLVNPLVNPLVTRVLADIDVVIALELATGVGVAIETELDTGIVVATETE